MDLLAMALAWFLAASPSTNASAPGVDTVAVYAQIVAAIRAEEPRGAVGRIIVSDQQFSAREKHSAGLLRELLSRAGVDGVHPDERRPGHSCRDCTLVILGPIVEYERVLYADPNDLSEEVEPSRGIPVKHWVNVGILRRCSQEGLRSGSCTEETVQAGRCRGGEQHSRRYYFTHEADGALRLMACVVTGVPDRLGED